MDIEIYQRRNNSDYIEISQKNKVRGGSAELIMPVIMSESKIKEFLNKMHEDPLYKQILALPKNDLHCHLDGSLRLSTIMDLIRKQEPAYPIDESKISGIVIKDDMMFQKEKSLVEYLRAFDITSSVLQDCDSLERVAYELCEDASKENVRYMEIRFAPILHTNKGMSLEDVTTSVLKGMEKAEKTFDIVTGLIICGMRHYVPCGIADNLLKSLPYSTHKEASIYLAMQTAQHTVEMAKQNHHVVGFDLAGGEDGNPAKTYKKAFYYVTNGYVPITVHAGEAVGAESIEESVNYLHCKRIGHGTNLYKNKLLLTYFMNERIPMEICLSSNLQTCSDITRFEDHPFKYYLEHRIRTAICTDNRLVSNTTVTKELYIAAKVFNLDMDHIKLIIMHGFNAALYNSYYPESQNAYNSLRKLRNKVEKELNYPDVKTKVTDEYSKKYQK
ncbi:MAG: Aminodeoxyfutalosine deaminase [bacterium ADurb.Bin363]|nr:MAG: Aminodeoxyfutalosine deaminase [bacterium ADurb.Bin363]